MRPQRSHRHINSKGQSVIQYAVLVILVMLGIIVAGPHMLSAVNAHFKLWDDAVSDSLGERIIEAKKSDIDINLPNCKCELKPGGCGAQGCKSSEIAMAKSCLPVGCDFGVSCVADDSCCKNVTRVDKCWRPGDDDLYHPASAPPDNTYHVPCQIGDRLFQYSCGTNVGKYVCQTDTVSTDGDRDCTPQCRPFNGSLANTTKCPYIGTAPLPDDTDTTLTDTLSPNTGCSPSGQIAAYCQYSCNSGYQKSDDGTSCVLPPSNQCVDLADNMQPPVDHSWNEFIRAYGIFVTPKTYATERFTTKFTLPIGGIFQVTLAAVTHGVVTIDGATVCSANSDQQTWLNSMVGVHCGGINLGAGIHTVVMTVDPLNGPNLPVVGAMTLSQTNTNFLLTSGLQSGAKWQGSLDCPSGQSWDYDKCQCQ